MHPSFSLCLQYSFRALRSTRGCPSLPKLDTSPSNAVPTIVRITSSPPLHRGTILAYWVARMPKERYQPCVHILPRLTHYDCEKDTMSKELKPIGRLGSCATKVGSTVDVLLFGSSFPTQYFFFLILAALLYYFALKLTDQVEKNKRTIKNN